MKHTIDVLGHEINCQFVYYVGPIFSDVKQQGYEYYFEIRFKDGRSHFVSISNNYTTERLRSTVLPGCDYVYSKLLTARQEHVVIKKRPKDEAKIVQLRNKIIKSI